MDDKPTQAEQCSNFWKYHWQGVVTLALPILLSPIIILTEGQKEFCCMYLILLCCLLWITECIPLYVTSMLPIFAVPVLGLLDTDRTARQFCKDTLAMFLFSLMVALAVEYCNLHKRLALKTILIVGCSPRNLHFGLITVTTFISMWISNSATTAMMCPIVKAILEELHANDVINIYMDESVEPEVNGKKHPSRPALAFYLSTAYAASIGGCGTLIGSGTNLVFKGIYENRFPDSKDLIDFPRFIAWSLPMVICQTALLFVFMQITHLGLGRPSSEIAQQLKKSSAATDKVRAVVLEKYTELGKMSVHEILVLTIFILMIILLFTRSPGIFTGWSDVINTVAIKTSPPVTLCLLLLFLLPMTCGCLLHFKKQSSSPVPEDRDMALVSWNYINVHTSWGLVFLLGGGFALSTASDNSGMSKMLGYTLQALQSWPIPLILFMSIFMVIFFTNFSANVPISNIIIPVLCEMAVSIKINPIFLVFPAGIACSYAFHLPVGTPPNAIVSSYAGIRPKYMFEGGVLITLSCMLLLYVNSYTMHRIIYPNMDLPEWSTNPN